MSFNWSMAFAGALGEGANQIDQYTARQNQLEDRQLENAAQLRKEKAALARQMTLAHFGYEQKDLYSNVAWDPSQKRMVSKQEVAGMSPEQKAQLVAIDERNLQQKVKGAEAISKIKQDAQGRSILEQAKLLGIPVDEYLKEKAASDFYGKNRGLTKSQKISAIEKMRSDYENDMMTFDTGAREGYIFGWGAEKATKTKPTIKEWAKVKRPEEYGLIWGGVGILGGRKASTTKGDAGKSPDVGNLISSLLQQPGSTKIQKNQTPSKPAASPQHNIIKKILNSNVNGAELIGSVAGKSINGAVDVIKNSPGWAEAINQYAIKANKTIGQAIIDLAKWAYSENGTKKASNFQIQQ